MTFPSFQFPLYRFADELCPPFLVLKDSIDAVKRAFWKARWGLLVVDLFPAHPRNIDDITNCYKGRLRRYLLLLSRRLLISSKTSKRESDMQYRAQVEGFTGHFQTCEALKTWAQDLDRKFSLKGCTVQVWKAKGVTGQVATYAGQPDREIVIGG